MKNQFDFEKHKKELLKYRKKLKPIPKIKKELDALWSKKVRERDGKCAMCGKKEKLQAHHYIKSKARSLKYRWDIRNGITLCFACHMFNVHKTASCEVVGAILNYAINEGVVNDKEVAEIACDDGKYSLDRDRGFLESCRINLEGEK